MNSKTAKKLKSEVITAMHGDKLTRKQRKQAMRITSTRQMYDMRKKNYLRKKRNQQLLSA